MIFGRSGCADWLEGIAPSKCAISEGLVVGLDIGPSTIAVVGDNSASLVKFCDTVVQP